jgi:hypothetical protein
MMMATSIKRMAAMMKRVSEGNSTCCRGKHVGC